MAAGAATMRAPGGALSGGVGAGPTAEEIAATNRKRMQLVAGAVVIGLILITKSGMMLGLSIIGFIAWYSLSRGKEAIGNIGIAALLAYCLFPFLWLVRLSMDPSASGKILPAHFTLTNYAAVMKNTDFMHAFLNSVIIAGSATAVAMLVGGGAGYALGRLPVPGRQYILFFVLSVSMFPSISIIGPLFQLWRSIGLFDTKTGLVLPNVTFALPLAIWTMSSFFRELPRDLEHAAYMDGATPFQAFRQVMLPLAAPGVFTAAILVFISAWNEFLFATTFSATNQSRPVTAAIASFQGKDSLEIPVGAISAASVVVMIPVLAMVLIFQRRIVAGLTAGGVKG